MKVSDAKSALDKLFEARMNGLIASLLIELTDQPKDFPEIIARYHGLASNHLEAHATATDFIEQILREGGA